jgi:hypothetical protein
MSWPWPRVYFSWSASLFLHHSMSGPACAYEPLCAGAPLRTGSDEHCADEVRPDVIVTEKSPR